MSIKSHYYGLSTNSSKHLPASGVLLVNLGTPQAPTAQALKPYLTEFLSDPRVIELSPWLWQPILHGFILRTRPRASAQAYQKIWTEKGSPLRIISEDITAALAEQLSLERKVHVKLAMRYGSPDILTALKQLQNAGVGKLVVLPLYPQYSATSTGSAMDGVMAQLQHLRFVPEVHMLNGYSDHPAYLDALAASVREHWQHHGQGEKLLLSFHGIPQKYADLGDPYPQQCAATTEALRARLSKDIPSEAILMSYQSRLGRTPWLKPYTDIKVRELGKQGVKKIDVICPGFAADCLETLEEIAIRNNAYFKQAGGETLNYIAALNTRKDHIDALASLIKPHL